LDIALFDPRLIRVGDETRRLLMLNMMKAGALALALTGFAIGGIAPAAAATYSSQGPGVSVTIHGGSNHGPGSWWWRHHHHHRVLVCKTSWHHHHKVRVCTWVWR
jgi:hypothetical protein